MVKLYGRAVNCKRENFGADFRTANHIPIFQIKQISTFNKCEPEESTWLRPEKDRTTGVNQKHCRLATQEEINNHLISIGKIPAGELLNTSIEPNKDGMYKYSTYNGSTFVGNCSTLTNKISVKPEIILSIDDEELPMVNIIKTKTIKTINLD